MMTIAARKIKKREEHYREMLDAAEEASIARVKAALEDVAAGRVYRGSAQDLIDEFDFEP